MDIKRLLGSDSRTSLIRKNIFFSFMIKGWLGLVFLLIIPITLKCIGNEYENGIWLTLSALLIWIDSFDIGLGNGMRNKLAKYIALGETEEARKVVSNTLIMLFVIIVPIATGLFLCIHFLDIYSLLNVDNSIVGNLQQVIMVSLIFVCSTFVLKFIGNLYLGLQLPAVSNLLVAAGYTLAFIGTYILYWVGGGSLLLIAIINTASPLIVYLIAYPYTFFFKYPHLRPRLADFSKDTARSLFGLGVKFFITQITASLIFITSSIIMSRLFSPSHVTPYQIAYRYFSIILHAFSIICIPYWSATTDAYERGDIEWIRKSLKRTEKVLLLCISGIVVLALMSGTIYDIWIGTDVNIPLSFTISMAIYMSIILYCLTYCYFLNGIGALNIQLICTIGGAVLFFILTPLLADKYNHPCVIIISMCVCNIPSFIFNRIQLKKILNGKAKGIWIN